MATRRLVPAVTVVAALVACVRLWPCASGHYEAAPVLSSYPERHPIKTMRELLAIALPETPAPPDAPALDEVVGKVLTASREDALRAVDDALAGNRRHHYEARVANLWWDVRDLLEASDGETLTPEAQAYLHWRRERMTQEKRGLPPCRKDADGASPPWYYNQDEQRAWEERRAAATAQYEADSREMEALMTSAPRMLLPHYMVQRGGMAFRRGHLEDAARWFAAVCWSQPHHPRAETALFMLARTRLEQARQADPNRRPEPEISRLRERFRNDTWRLLREYNRRHPKGRYQADVAGWEGALYSMNGAPWMALQCYVRQLDCADQPEVVRSASREIERCLRACLELDAEENDDASQVMADIARRPLAAMRVMSFLLDGAAVVDYERWPFHSDLCSEPDIVNHIAARLARSRSPKLLSQLASAVADHPQPYEASAWQPAFLAILAWAASEQGEHAQAIRLCEKTPALLSANDDLQYCRAVVLQRMGRSEEALAALRALRAQFPESRLSNELGLRMAKCLRALHREGEAIVELVRARNALPKATPLHPGDPPAPSADPLPLHRDSELAQYQDVLEAFAPIEQLEVAAHSPELPAAEARRLRSLLLARVVSAERWADVERVAALTLQHDVQEKEEVWNDLYLPKKLSTAEKAELARTLARFHALLEQPENDAWKQAVLCWHLAHVWEAARGMISLEALGSDGWNYMYGDYRWTRLRLRTNALALGFDPGLVGSGLDAQDELRHTYEYCLRTASLAPQSPLAAKALHNALECLKRMAEASPYAQARAFEQDWSTLSRQLYDRLQREHPDSPEARTLAAWWTFPAPAEARGWMPGNGPPWAEDHHVVFALKGGHWGGSPYYQPQVDSQEEYARQQKLGELWFHVQNLSGLGAQGQARRVQEEAASIQAALIPLGGLRESYGGKWSWYRTMNALDDVELIARHAPESLPHLAPYFARFFLTPFGQTPQPEPDDATHPLADFIAYRLILQGPTPFESWEKRAGQWQQYLAERPHSLKTEAAELQLARAVMRQYRGAAGAENHVWPDAPFKGAYIGIFVHREKPFEAAPVFAALDRYEMEYPQGRYLTDIRLMRGAASIDAGDYTTALRLLCGILNDEGHRELHLDAGLNLAQCFELLHEPARRMPLAKAIANDAEALQKFRQFAFSPTCGHRLRVMVDFVESMKK